MIDYHGIVVQFFSSFFLVWDNDGTLRNTLQGHNAPITQLEHNQNRIVSLGADQVKIWDLRTGHHAIDLSNPNNHYGNRITCFTTTGDYVFTGNSVKKIKFFF